MAQLDLQLLVAQRGGTVVLSRALLVESRGFQWGRNLKATLDMLRKKKKKKEPGKRPKLKESELSGYSKNIASAV